MTDVSYQKLIAQAEMRRERAIEQAEREYREALEAVRVLRRLNGGGSSRLAHGMLSGAVLEAVEHLDGIFTVKDVEGRIQELAPEVAERASLASISTTLRRLVGKRIYLVEPGNGIKPSYYGRLDGQGGTMSLEGSSCREPIAGRGENERPTAC